MICEIEPECLSLVNMVAMVARVAFVANLAPSVWSQDLAACNNWFRLHHDCIRGRGFAGLSSDTDCDGWYAECFREGCQAMPEDSNRCFGWLNPSGQASGDYPFSRPGTKAECIELCAQFQSSPVSGSDCDEPHFQSVQCYKNCEEWCPAETTV